MQMSAEWVRETAALERVWSAIEAGTATPEELARQSAVIDAYRKNVAGASNLNDEKVWREISSSIQTRIRLAAAHF